MTLRLEFFSFLSLFCNMQFTFHCHLCYTLLLTRDLAGYKSHSSADTLIQIYPWVVDNFNCYQQESGRIPTQTPLSRNDWSFVTYWKIKVAEGIIWLELSWQIFTVLCLQSNNLCLEKYIEYYGWEGKRQGKSLYRIKCTTWPPNLRCKGDIKTTLCLCFRDVWYF